MKGYLVCAKTEEGRRLVPSGLGEELGFIAIPGFPTIGHSLIIGLRGIEEGMKIDVWDLNILLDGETLREHFHFRPVELEEGITISAFALQSKAVNFNRDWGDYIRLLLSNFTVPNE
jgi:hypothetical protein